jgi:predicted enzyme involved in methoxymalonyl-ACP biosynthesis
MLTFRVSDRFGDSGLTGIVGLTFEKEVARMTDFVLSCRVMGRNVEETMLHAAVTHCRARGVPSLLAELTPTARNAPCLEFLARSGLQRTSAYQFQWDVRRPYGCPPWVNLDDRAAAISTADR